MTPQHLKPYDSVLETIGWTPLIRLARVGQGVRSTQRPITGPPDRRSGSRPAAASHISSRAMSTWGVSQIPSSRTGSASAGSSRAPMTRALAQPPLLDRPVVLKGGKLIGIISRYDLLQQLIGTR